MPEYIDREAALAACRSAGIAAIWACRQINALPSADVVEVVRCGECRYRYKTYNSRLCSRGIFVNGVVPPDDWYCSDGKLKDGGQDDV